MIIECSSSMRDVISMLEEINAEARTSQHYIDSNLKKIAEIKSRRGIGFWFSKDEPNLPDPKNYIDNSWNEEEKQKVINYLDSSVHKRSMFLGISPCRICGCANGYAELRDDSFTWPQGFSHYLKEHNVKPPQEFIDYVLSKL